MTGDAPKELAEDLGEDDFEEQLHPYEYHASVTHNGCTLRLEYMGDIVDQKGWAWCNKFVMDQLGDRAAESARLYRADAQGKISIAIGWQS